MSESWNRCWFLKDPTRSKAASRGTRLADIAWPRIMHPDPMLTDIVSRRARDAQIIHRDSLGGKNDAGCPDSPSWARRDWIILNHQRPDADKNPGRGTRRCRRHGRGVRQSSR